MKYNDFFSFDQDKAVEVMVYFAQKAPITDIYHLAKVCYFSDLLHLEHYGRPICGDNYIKMNHGPVPSAIYNLFNSVKKFNHQVFLEAFCVDGNKIIAERDANLGLLSPSDIECLDKAIAEYGRKSFDELKNKSHDSAWESAEDNCSIDYGAMISMLPNASRLTEYIND